MFTFCGTVEFTTSTSDNVINVVSQWIRSTVPANLIFADRNSTVGYRVLVALDTPRPVRTFTCSRLIYPLATGDFPPVNPTCVPLRTGGPDQWCVEITRLDAGYHNGTQEIMDVIFWDPLGSGTVGTDHIWHYNSTMVVQFWGYCM